MEGIRSSFNVVRDITPASITINIAITVVTGRFIAVLISIYYSSFVSESAEDTADDDADDVVLC